jgi:hypothetical protein
MEQNRISRTTHDNLDLDDGYVNMVDCVMLYGYCFLDQTTNVHRYILHYGRLSLVVRCWLLVVGCWVLAVVRCPLSVGRVDIYLAIFNNCYLDRLRSFPFRRGLSRLEVDCWKTANGSWLMAQDHGSVPQTWLIHGWPS